MEREGFQARAVAGAGVPIRPYRQSDRRQTAGLDNKCKLKPLKNMAFSEFKRLLSVACENKTGLGRPAPPRQVAEDRAGQDRHRVLRPPCARG